MNRVELLLIWMIDTMLFSQTISIQCNWTYMPATIKCWEDYTIKATTIWWVIWREESMRSQEKDKNILILKRENRSALMISKIYTSKLKLNKEKNITSASIQEIKWEIFLIIWRLEDHSVQLQNEETTRICD